LADGLWIESEASGYVDNIVEVGAMEEKVNQAKRDEAEGNGQVK